MKKIDIGQWKEFVISDLFTIKRPAARSQTKYDDGDVPFVTSGNYNNGILKYLKPKENEELDSGNCITVSPIDGSSFYQEKDFLGRGGAGSSIISLYNPNLNLYNGYFIATVIRSVCKKYAYSDMANKDTIGAEKIKLPINQSGEPDYLYMETYMRKLELKANSLLADLLAMKQLSVSQIDDTTKWGTFHLYDESLFTIDSGTKLDKVKMDTSVEEIAFVGRSNINNGITTKVKRIDGIEPYKSGNLTLALGGAYLGSCFVQPENFYTSQNVVVLIPNNDMDYYAKQFIATAIFVESQNNYKAFIKELNAYIKRDFKIKLPIDKKGNPDWDYMIEYMKRIELKANQVLEMV